MLTATSHKAFKHQYTTTHPHMKKIQAQVTIKMNQDCEMSHRKTQCLHILKKLIKNKILFTISLLENFLKFL